MNPKLKLKFWAFITKINFVSKKEVGCCVVVFCSVQDWRRKRREEGQEADCRDYHKWHTSQPEQNTALGRERGDLR